MTKPVYWMYESSGVLRPAVEAYLNDEPLTGAQIAALRAYCRQWIMSDVWDHPDVSEEGRGWLAELRSDVEGLTSRAAIASWLYRAAGAGLDPL